MWIGKKVIGSSTKDTAGNIIVQISRRWLAKFLFWLSLHFSGEDM